jgi:hypothetical protein
MSLLHYFAARIGRLSEGEARTWAAHEFHAVVAEYGRARSVQPWPPEARRTCTVAVPEQPMKFTGRPS